MLKNKYTPITENQPCVKNSDKLGIIKLSSLLLELAGKTDAINSSNCPWKVRETRLADVSLQEYWKGVFPGSALDYDFAYIKEIVSLLQPIKGQLNLEIGSGFGRWSRLFADREFVAVEIDRRAAAASHAELHLEVINADTRYLPFKEGVFDCVFSIGVVEHFPETVRAINEHRRVCRHDGKLMIAVPNLTTPFSLPSLIRAIIRGYNYNEYRAHFGKRFTGSEFRRLLERCNCRSITLRLIGISLPRPLDSIFSRFQSTIGAEYFAVVDPN